MSIPYVRQFEFEYGRCDTIAPGVNRVIADNPGPFTYTGTGVYIIGDKNVAVIDPGPDTDAHSKALHKALDGRRVTHVLVTHHHIDHSPMAKPLAAKHGCKVYGYGLQASLPAGGEIRLEAGDDLSFKPDVEIRDGHIFEGDGWTIEAIHTPGHTSNHMCYALKEENILFSGDHIMGWSTSVVSPPDGDMGDYLASLETIKDRHFRQVWPTHGPVITAVDEFIQAYIDHRHNREAQIYDCLKDGLGSIPDMVTRIYADVDKRLHPAAAHSVLAHLIHMCKTGHVQGCDIAGINGQYTLTGTAK